MPRGTWNSCSRIHSPETTMLLSWQKLTIPILINLATCSDVQQHVSAWVRRWQWGLSRPSQIKIIQTCKSTIGKPIDPQACSWNGLQLQLKLVYSRLGASLYRPDALSYSRYAVPARCQQLQLHTSGLKFCLQQVIISWKLALIVKDKESYAHTGVHIRRRPE